MNIIDISLPISPAMVVWPGAPKTEFSWRRSMEKGDRSNNSNFFMNSHSGTHVDAPLHFIDHGKSVEKIDLDFFVGEAFLIDLTTEKKITIDLLQKNWPTKKIDRLLIKTNNSEIWEKNQTDFVEDIHRNRKDVYTPSSKRNKKKVTKKIKSIEICYLFI